MRTRAERRHAAEKAKRRALREVSQRYAGTRWENDVRVIGRVARTPVICSCIGCGNPRRSYGAITAPEQRAKDALDHDVREIGVAT
jgi:hypothetical protein